MEFAFLLILMLIGHFNPSDAQFPAECSCPDSCICSLPDQTIDCVEQNLKHVPVELNSCSWPGITKVYSDYAIIIIIMLTCHAGCVGVDQ